jgi:hypothetical protein
MFFVFLSCPDSLGRPGAKGAALQASRNSFSEGPDQIVCAAQKAQPTIWEGNRNPPGLELASEAAERGNYPEAKPNEERLKGRRACKKNKRPSGRQQITMTFGRSPMHRFPFSDRKEEETHVESCASAITWNV